VVNDGFSCTYLEGVITMEVYSRGNLTEGRKLRVGEEVKNLETASHKSRIYHLHEFIGLVVIRVTGQSCDRVSRSL
jgi:hypothetical protein